MTLFHLICIVLNVFMGVWGAMSGLPPFTVALNFAIATALVSQLIASREA